MKFIAPILELLARMSKRARWNERWLCQWTLRIALLPCVLVSACGGDSPSSSDVSTAISQHVPEYLQITKVELMDLRKHEVDQRLTISQRFKSTGVADRPTFVEAAREGDVILISEATSAQFAVEMFGTISSYKWKDTWRHDITFDGQPLAPFGMVRTEIPNPSVALNTPEETDYRAKQLHEAKELIGQRRYRQSGIVIDRMGERWWKDAPSQWTSSLSADFSGLLQTNPCAARHLAEIQKVVTFSPSAQESAQQAAAAWSEFAVASESARTADVVGDPIDVGQPREVSWTPNSLSSLKARRFAITHNGFWGEFSDSMMGTFMNKEVQRVTYNWTNTSPSKSDWQFMNKFIIELNGPKSMGVKLIYPNPSERDAALVAISRVRSEWAEEHPYARLQCSATADSFVLSIDGVFNYFSPEITFPSWLQYKFSSGSYGAREINYVARAVADGAVLGRVEDIVDYISSHSGGRFSFAFRVGDINSSRLTVEGWSG